MVTCMPQPLLFLLFLLFIASSARGHGGVKFQLIHRHDLHPKWRAGGAPLERLRHLVHSDTVRLRAISRKVRLKQGALRRQTVENNRYEPACNNGSRGGGGNASGELPMHSGADYGVGQYLVKFKVGSPAQKLVLIADTGSDLTWSNCRYKCRGGRCGRQRRRVFRADRSSSFRTLPCSSSICKTDLANLFSLSRCPSPLDPCSYDYRYLSLSLSPTHTHVLGSALFVK